MYDVTVDVAVIPPPPPSSEVGGDSRNDVLELWTWRREKVLSEVQRTAWSAVAPVCVVAMEVGAALIFSLQG